jgi:hypothetical protein
LRFNRCRVLRAPTSLRCPMPLDQFTPMQLGQFTPMQLDQFMCRVLGLLRRGRVQAAIAPPRWPWPSVSSACQWTTGTTQEQATWPAVVCTERTVA